MELRTLRYFLAAANEKNITKAADILHVTQPTLSRQIMDLEKELGVPLMIRGKKRLALTDDGIFFRQRAEEIVELADRLERSFSERNAEVSGVISIGAVEAIGSRLFPKLIKRFSEKYPLVRFHLYNEVADSLKERMDKRLIDAGLLLEPVDTSKYDYIRLSQKETWGVLMRDDHPLAQRESIRPEEVTQYPLILPLRTRARAEILNWLKKEEKDPEHPTQLHAAPQRGAAGGRRAGVCVLSGRCAGHPQQPAAALYPYHAGAHYPQRVGLEEKQPVYSRCVSVRAGNQYDAGQNRISGGRASRFGTGGSSFCLIYTF